MEIVKNDNTSTQQILLSVELCLLKKAEGGGMGFGAKQEPDIQMNVPCILNVSLSDIRFVRPQIEDDDSINMDETYIKFKDGDSVSIKKPFIEFSKLMLSKNESADNH